MKNRKTISANIIWRFLERCGAQGVQALVEIILARLLDPEHFGIIALVSVFIRIMQIFVDCGFTSALIQKHDADQIDFSSVFYFNLVMCLLLYTLMFFVSPLIADFYKMPDLTPVIRILSLILIISGVKSVQHAYVSRHMMFKKFFLATLTGTVFAAIIGIWMAFKGYGVWALVAQHLANTFIDTIMLWITVKWRPSLQFQWNRLKRLISYGWKLLISSLIDTIYNELRQLIIGKKFTSADLAIYNRGKQLPHLFISNINTAIDSVLFPAMSSEQNNKDRIRDMTCRSIKISTFLLMPVMMGLAVCAEQLVRLLLTDKWLPCVFYLRAFCFTYAFYPIHTANLNAIKAMGRSDLFLKLEIIKKIVGLTVMLITVFISMKAMALGMIGTTILSQIINSWPNKKLLNYKYRSQLFDILPHIVLSCIMGTIVYCVKYCGFGTLITLIIQISLGITIYIFGAKKMHLDSYDYVLGIILEYIRKKKK